MTEDAEADEPHSDDPEGKARTSNEARPDPVDTNSGEGGIQGVSVNKDASLIASESLESVGEGTGAFAMPVATPQAKREATGKSALLVGAGILISRIVGLLRQRVFAHYFGTSAAGDAFGAAFRIPNFLQNVFGEGALSASFIPVYAKLLARDDKEEAARVASAVLTLLALVTSVIVILGVLTTPYLISIIAPGFEGERRELVIRLVKIFFPGAGLLVLSAWCLGVLNSHRRFFLSYTAPVIWNVAIIAALIGFGRHSGTLDQFQMGGFQFHLAEMVAWGSVVGSALQFAIQLPTVLWLVRRVRLVLDITTVNVRTVMANFFPVFVSRGIIQISAFIDVVLASLLPQGAVIAVNYAQSLYTLPVSLFGMSVSAAELPAMSSALGTGDEVSAELRKRLDAGLQRIAFFIVPSILAFLALGDVIVAVLYQGGQFNHDATLYVWGILAGSTVGLLASTLGRLYSSTYYALHDTRTPLRYAIIRVTMAIAVGYVVAIHLPPLLGIDPKWGAAGLTASSGIAGWIEFALLRRTLNRRIGRTGLELAYVAKLWLAAACGAATGWGIKLVLGDRHPLIVALAVLIPYGLVYFGITSILGLPDSRALFDRALRVLFRRKH
ncbi:MAG: murein biosynthesis integral membrane protein MurJ [Pyrinomonadaceae bacterium]